VFFNGEGLLDVDEEAVPLKDDSFLLVFNAHSEPVPFTLPPETWGATWKPVLTTAESRSVKPVSAGEVIEAAPRSVTVLCRPSKQPAADR
jgi:isoamylase